MREVLLRGFDLAIGEARMRTADVAAAAASTARIAYCNLRLFPICCSLKIQGGYMSHPYKEIMMFPDYACGMPARDSQCLVINHALVRTKLSPPFHRVLAFGAHAATVSAPIRSLASRHVSLGGTAVGEDSFPFTDGGHLPADRMFLAALTSRS